LKGDNPLKVEFDNNTINSNFGGLKTQRGKSFSQILKDALESVNTYQKDYESVLTRQLFSEDIDLHDVVIAGEKARLSLELALQIRNKAIEAYQEIMRMQI